MAGGNISPRQKMINMMYLVLTALLALNVSAQILEAFQTLKESIHHSAEKFDKKNDEVSEMIKFKVKEEMEQGNNKNEYIIGLTDEVMAESRRIKKILDGVTDTLDVIAGWDPETGEYAAMKTMEQNYQFWMGSGKEDANGGRGAGAAFRTRNMLNGYSEWGNEFIKQNDTSGVSDIHFEPLCEDAEKGEHKQWEFVTFNSKPVIADLAMVEKFKLDVSEMEYEMLTYLKQKLGAVKFKIDSLILVAAPRSEVVVAGMPFESRLFVSMASDDIKPEFLAAGGSIKTEDGGNTGVLTINTNGGGFTKGGFEKELGYNVKAKVPTADGGYEELSYKGTYKVRKPEVVITSASVQNLYWKCGNKLNVDVPALGELYNPVFKASSAQALKSKSDKKVVTIVPTGKTCVLSVSSNTNGQNIKVDDVKYKVIKPPRPHLLLIVNGKEYDGVSPISKKSTVTVVVKPDHDFLSALPRDARYAIDQVELLVQRSLGAPTKADSKKGSGKDASKGLQFKLGAKLKQDSPGTKIYFKLHKIYRLNFQNKKVEEKFSERDLMMGAVIK